MLKNEKLSTLPISLAYRADIDGLRAISVILVVGFHFFPNFIRGGFIGVDIFFVISGYLITRILAVNFHGEKFSILNFYSKRIVRIFPALLVILIFCSIFGWYLLLPNEYELLGKHIAAGASFTSNFIFLNETGYFDVNSELKPLLHLWSLGIEAQFYAFWPITLYLLWRRNCSWLIVILSMTVISFICNLYFSSSNLAFDFFSPFTRFWELQVGALIGILNLTNKKHLNLPLGFEKIRNGIRTYFMKISDVFLISIGTFLIFFSSFYLTGNHRYPSWWALMPVFGASCFLALSPSSMISRVLSHKTLVFIGKISYPLYLWHWPLLCFFHIMNGDQLEVGFKVVLIIASICLAFLTNRFIENPIKKFKQINSTATLLIICMALIGCLGFYIASEKGLSKRLFIQDAIKLESGLLNPQHFIKSDGSCDSLLAKTTLYPNVCITNSVSPKSMIIGDSHAIALYGGIRNGDINESAILFAGNGCLPLVGYVVQDDYVPRSWCLNYVGNILDAIDKMPTIEKVYVNTRGPVYFSGEGYGNEGKNKLSIARINGDDSLSQEERFYVGYSNFIKLLIAKKIKVTVITEVPELGEEPKNCIAQRPVIFIKDQLSSCSQPKQNVLLRKARYFDVIKRIKEDNPDLNVYHGLSSFCDDATCYGKGPEGLWYWDDDHLSLLGSIKLLKDVVHENSK